MPVKHYGPWMCHTTLNQIKCGGVVKEIFIFTTSLFYLLPFKITVIATPCLAVIHYY